MKKLYKIVLFVIFVFVFIFLFAIPIGAEDVINDVPSDLGQQFKEKWLPLIIDFITALGGTSVGLLIIKTILEVLKYLSNNDELVRKGYAKEIMKVVENAKKETEKENVI